MDMIKDVKFVQKYFHLTKRKKWSWRKFKFEIIRSETGFYEKNGAWNWESDFPYHFYTAGELIEMGHLVYGEEVYQKSYVYIHFTSGDSKIKRFNNYNEGLNYYNALNVFGLGEGGKIKIK